MTARVNTLLGVLLLSGTVSAQDHVQTRMQAWSRALGVECTHCHVDGAWTDTSKPIFEFAQRMNRMVSALNAGPLKDVASISCWTCHRGRTAPPRLPRESWEKIRADHIAQFADPPARTIAMSAYAAWLGVGCSHGQASARKLTTRSKKTMVR